MKHQVDGVVERLGGMLAGWLPTQRWFAGKGRSVAKVEIVQTVPLLDALDRGGPLALVALARVAFTDCGPSECYQVPVGVRRTPPPKGEPAVIAEVGGLVCYDALGDPEPAAALAELAAPGGGRDGPTAGHTRILGGEQTNTSVVIDERRILKVFRRLETGVNPELVLHRALARAGSRHVPRLLGAVETEADDATVILATLHEYVAGAVDGWAMALASLRDLLAEPGGEAAAAGGDFAAEAHRLAAAVAEVHDGLARELGMVRMDETARTELRATLLGRLDAALAIVPELARHERKLRAVFSAVGALPAGEPLQRVHGDLHLGQTLRATGDWLLIDFEGEPAAPLADRVAPQSPLRDVAGMLRSFDYAAHHHMRVPHDAVRGDAAELAGRARAWVERNRAAFCAGYAEVGGQDPRARSDLLRVFELEKAVYEAAYEARYRPTWLDIPLRAVGRIAAA